MIEMTTTNFAVHTKKYLQPNITLNRIQIYNRSKIKCLQPNMPHPNIPNNMFIIIKFITLIPCNCNRCSHTVTECVHSHEAWFISICIGGMLRHSPFVISFRDSRHKVWISIEISKIIIITCMFTNEIMNNHGSSNNLFLC